MRKLKALTLEESFRKELLVPMGLKRNRLAKKLGVPPGESAKLLRGGAR